MPTSNINKVCVIGAGLMGKQIALNAALSGFTTCLFDSFPDAADKAAVWAKDYLADRVGKQKMTQVQADAAAAHFSVSKDLTVAATGADLVIEAIVEIKEEKEKLFRAVDAIVSETALITTNSSFLVSSLFADCVSNPDRLANLHYFNPALVMKLVEIVRGPHTAEETVMALVDFVNKLGKIPVVIQKEVDGFIVNHIANELTCAALKLVSRGIASPRDIDLALENGLNHPMGPFRMMDLTGIDLAHFVLEEKAKNGEVREGAELVKAKYEAGEYGRKTGCGWYDYTKK